MMLMNFYVKSPYQEENYKKVEFQILIVQQELYCRIGIKEKSSILQFLQTKLNRNDLFVYKINQSLSIKIKYWKIIRKKFSI